MVKEKEERKSSLPRIESMRNRRNEAVYQKIPQEDSLRVKYKLCEIVR